MGKRAVRLAVFFMVCACVGGAAGAQSATQFRGNAARTGAFATAAPAEISHIRWQFATRGRLLGSPVVADGLVLVGSEDHNLYAVESASGHLKWSCRTGGNITSTPAVANGKVYVLSIDGKAYAVDEQTGKPLWSFATGGESRANVAGMYGMLPAREVIPDVWDFYLSSPAVADGMVYFGSGDHTIYALDAATGALRWKFVADGVVHASPSIRDGRLFVGSEEGTFYSLDAATGALLWSQATGRDATHFMMGIPGSAAVADGVVVFGSRDNFLYAFEAASGKPLWKLENGGSWVIASPAARDGMVYVTTSDSRKFRALELRTGKEKFTTSYGTFGFSSPALAGGHAYFGTFDGTLYDVDLAAGGYHSRFQTPETPERRQLLNADGTLNYNEAFGPLTADGQMNNTLEASMLGIYRILRMGSILASPAVDQGVVYVGSANGILYALD